MKQNKFYIAMDDENKIVVTHPQDGYITSFVEFKDFVKEIISSYPIKPKEMWYFESSKYGKEKVK